MGYTANGKLRDIDVRDALTNRQQVFLWDSEVRGFGLRVTAGGAKTFILQYGIDGRKRRGRIGSYPEWSVEAARREAKALKRRVARGEDPFRERVERRKAKTVADLCDRYEAEHLPRKRPSSQRDDLRMIEKMIKPALGKMKIEDVRFADVDRLHARLGENTPITANRVLAVISKMFSLASGPWELRDGNPCKGVQRYSENRRERFLSPDEVERLFNVLANASSRDRQSANAVRLLLLTGARRGEMLSARWDQFDLENGVWTKPSAHTKQKKTHRIPLNGGAAELLKNMRAEAERKANKTGEPVSDHVFPSRTNTGAQADLKKYWDKVRKEANLPGLRVHDLRHSFASLLASNGQPLTIIGALLGHTQAQTTARYAHLLDAPLREASEGAFSNMGGGK